MKSTKKYTLSKKVENSNGTTHWEHCGLYNNIEDADTVFQTFESNPERYGKVTKGFKLVERETKQVVKEVYK